MSEVLYKIVRMLDEYRVVIDVGSSAGIKPGAKFRVIDTSEPVIDPETKKQIDTLDKAKAIITAVEVREYVSICESAQYEQLSIAQLFNTSISKQMTSPSRKRLNVDITQVDTIPMSDEPIRLGDKVRPIND